MTNKNDEKAAEEYEKLVHMTDFIEDKMSEQLIDYMRVDRKEAFLAGRESMRKELQRDGWIREGYPNSPTMDTKPVRLVEVGDE